MTDPDFKFPQLWRTSLAVDRKLPWGITGTAEVIYNKDMNGIVYVNANLPAAQSAFAGVDARPRWTSHRLNATPGNTVTANYVMQNQSEGKSWNVAFSAAKSLARGLAMRAAYSYGETRNMGDPGSTAATNWSSTAHAGDPNNPGIGYAVFNGGSAGHRAYIQQDSYLRKHRGEYAKRGAVFTPLVTRLDVSLLQQIFGSAGGARHAGEIRLDILNLGNMLNSNWGVSQRVVQNQILTNAAADAQGRVSYRLAVVSRELLAPKTFQTNAALQDVYTMMVSFRYRFN